MYILGNLSKGIPMKYMNSIKIVSVVAALFICATSFALSLGSTQKYLSGELIAATQVEAFLICKDQGLNLPTNQQLVQILANKRNGNEIKNATFWSNEAGTLLFSDWGYVSDGFNWAELVAGVICI
jgi:hypothetical protein